MVWWCDLDVVTAWSDPVIAVSLFSLFSWTIVLLHPRNPHKSSKFQNPPMNWKTVLRLDKNNCCIFSVDCTWIIQPEKRSRARQLFELILDVSRSKFPIHWWSLHHLTVRLHEGSKVSNWKNSNLKIDLFKEFSALLLLTIILEFEYFISRNALKLSKEIF